MALTDNLVAYWKMDESSGNAADSVGSNTGVNSNVTYDTGKINNGAVFSGTNAKLNCGRLSDIEGIGAVTIAGWFKQTTLDQSRAFFCKPDIGGATSANFGLFSHTSGNLYVEPAAAANRGYIDYSAYMSANTWTHIAMVFNGSGTGNSGRLKIYFDGTERTLTYEGTIGTTCGDGTGDFLFGERGSGAFDFVGMMDEIGVWTRALSGAEITSLYNSGDGLQYPFGASAGNIKKLNNIAWANVKKFNGIAKVNIKKINGIAAK